MFHAASYAFIDSINILLIGVLFAIAVLHPTSRRFTPIAAVLVLGDWLGVLALSIPTLLLFQTIEQQVTAALKSPFFGMALIAFGLVSAILAARGGDPAPMINRLARPLQRPSWSTFGAGFVLGVLQSLSSFPFFAGLAYLTALDLAPAWRYATLVLYATIALSLPATAAVIFAIVLRQPDSWLARFVAFLRSRSDAVIRGSGYGVAAMLIGLGAIKLLV